ncbi:MAG: phosphodiesterase [Burkholderiales bacterium]|nr:phosphodiesterase [Burkholderiales bacterium]
MLLCQFSDPHVVVVPPAGRVDTARHLAAAVAQVNAMAVRPDVLLLTGDLTDNGTEAEYGLLAQLLAPLQIPVLLLPGNHDDRGALQAAFPQMPWLRGAGGFVQYVVEDLPLRIVVLDTTVPGEEGGHLCEQRLQWLDRTLAASARPTVIAQHHPPVATGLVCMDRVALANGADEEAIIRRHPQVERVVCGHLHRNVFARFGGTLVSVCPSTERQLQLSLAPDAPLAMGPDASAFQLHRWDGARLSTHTLELVL